MPAKCFNTRWTRVTKRIIGDFEGKAGEPCRRAIGEVPADVEVKLLTPDARLELVEEPYV